MFAPFYKITNTILKQVGAIDAAKQIIESAAIIDSWEAKLKKDSSDKTILYTAVLEGNKLNEDEVRDILEGKEILARESDIQEIKSLKRSLDFTHTIVNKIGPGRPYILTAETITELHRLLTEGLIPFEISGKFRLRQIVIKHAVTGEIAYSPPPAVEVEYLIDDLVNWINSEEGRQLHPVLKSGIIHFEIHRIQPFSLGNTKVAIFLADLINNLDGYGMRGFLSLSEYFNSSAFKYHKSWQDAANQSVIDTNELDITEWLQFYIEGYLNECLNLKEQVMRVSSQSHVKDKLGFHVELNERHMLIIEYLKRHGSMMNKDFRKIFPDYSDDTVLRELKFLKQKGLVKKVGGTKKAKYVLG